MGEAGQSREGESITPLLGGGTENKVAAPPQQFNSLPAPNENASYINQATSYLGSYFSHSSVEYGGKDSCKSLSHPHELLRSTSGGDGNSPVSVCVSPGARCSTSSESPTSAANSPSAESTETPSQASNAIVTSNWLGLSGTSMFQGLIDRALRTVRGSADDIGWLQHDPEMPPAEDGTDRIRPVPCASRILKKNLHFLLLSQLTADVESCSIRVIDSSIGAHRSVNKEDGSSPSVKDDFINRLLETGATESSSSNTCSNQKEENRENTSSQLKQTLCNLVAATNDLRCLKDELYPTALRTGLDKDLSGQLALNELESEMKSFRVVLDDVLVKFKSLSRELQSHRDTDAKVRADLKRIRGELENEVVELQQCNGELSALRAERDATSGAFFPVLSPGNKLASRDKARDKQRDLQDMESILKDLTVLASSRLQELKDLHEERTKILEKMSVLQKNSKSVTSISSSQACLSLKDQLRKSKEAVFKYMALLEKLQVEKDSIFWREREMSIKSELVDVARRSSSVADSRIASLDVEIQKQLDDKSRIKTRLENISKERGRKEIFADMKALVASFPGEMGSMRSQLENYKETAGGIHSLRADVQSLSVVLCRKTKECEALHLRSADYASQLHDLNATVCDLKNSHEELKLFLDMYKRESTDPRDIAEAKEQEYRAWAHVESLKSSLDEQNLELRVKAANEAEAVSQQMLAAAEAEIADLRQKIDDCKR
ncbi:hypothetical protein F2Q70_00028854 [Brassica cretica]|uniref:E3 ubiquitin protein ligase n=1 Tax=Brassica cretica TaxID=69181 RepID=A0A8S9LF50_BRACR|nr:hypothetical protein F2Q70_00028854 [Brassica cretica]